MVKNKSLSILKKYRDNVFELSEIEQKLHNAEVHDSVQSAAKHPYSKHSVPVDGVPPSEETYRMQIRAQELRQEICKAEQIVRSLPNSRLRKAAQIYYMDDNGSRMTWEEVACVVGFSSGGDALRKAVERSLEFSKT